MSTQPKSTGAKNRCAIYTRKSCEEGLELEFNSLHAQRESAEAFIASQQHEGWECLPERYDEGGFSGGINGHREFVCLIGGDEVHAMDMLDSIKMELVGNELLLADYPEVVFPIQALDGIANESRNFPEASFLVSGAKPAARRFVQKASRNVDLPASCNADVPDRLRGAARTCAMKTSFSSYLKIWASTDGSVTRPRKRIAPDSVS